MVYKSLRFIPLSFAFLLGLTPLFAINSWDEQDNLEDSSFGPKTVNIVSTGKNIQIATTNGTMLSLPERKKELTNDTPFAISVNSLADLDVSYLSSIKLHEKMIEQKEMQELSSELGIRIRDNTHLDLYREISYWIGVPYKYGAMSKTAVDCSGFTSLVYKAVFDKSLPRVSREMSNTYKEDVDKDDLEPGDLVFFATRRRQSINHVGIYIGEGKFVHASRSRGVIVDSLDNGYFLRSWRRGAKVE